MLYIFYFDINFKKVVEILYYSSTSKFYYLKFGRYWKVCYFQENKYLDGFIGF